MARPQPPIRGHLAQYYSQETLPGRCGRLQGRHRQVREILQSRIRRLVERTTTPAGGHDLRIGYVQSSVFSSDLMVLYIRIPDSLTGSRAFDESGMAAAAGLTTTDTSRQCRAGRF